jgi:hypothetical protein
MTFPNITYSALLIPGGTGVNTTYSVNGSNLNVGNPSASTAGAGMNLTTFVQQPTSVIKPIPINGTAAGAIGSYIDNPTNTSSASYLNADQFRIVSMKWRLVYTGTASGCSGIVSVVSVPQVTDPVITKTAGTIRFFNPGATGSTGVLSPNTTTNGAIQVLPWETPITNVFTRDVVMLRPETTPEGLCKHNGQYLWQNTLDRQVLPVYNADAIDLVNGGCDAAFSSAYTGAASVTGTVTFGSLAYLDPAWESTLISLDGVGGSFRFETVVCCEFIPNINSSFYDFGAVDAKSDVEGIAKIEALVSAQPAAVQGSSTKFCHT